MSSESHEIYRRYYKKTFWSLFPDTLYVQLLYLWPWPRAEPWSASPLGSLLYSTDPLVDGERACCANPLSIHGLSFRSTSADRHRRRVMKKPLKALRGTEYCRWDSWRCPGQKWRRKLKIMWCCGVIVDVLRQRRRKKKQFLYKGSISVLCACTACGIRIFDRFEY